jgi:hypothetical protein
MGEHGQRRRAVPTSPSASDSAGNVYVTDPGFVSSIGVATDAADDLYVADTNNNRIQKFGTAATPATRSEGTRARTASSAAPAPTTSTARPVKTRSTAAMAPTGALTDRC